VGILKNVIMVLDTETASLQGAVYDVGYTIADAKGNILLTKTFLIEEVFTDSKKMMGAFFASKMFTHYARMLQDGLIRIESWQHVVDNMRWDTDQHNVNIIAAYNLPFDRRVLAETHKALGYVRPILPRMKQLDLYRFACEAKLNTQLYRDCATANNWLTDAGNFRTNAECAYRYISGNWDFIESHTALHDAIIETEIMAACFRAHKKIPYNVIKGGSWKIVNSS
jgi:hypothetical protein